MDWEEYFASQDRQGEIEEGQFLDAGWTPLDCSRPFYEHPPSNGSVGDVRTVVRRATSSDGLMWFWKEGRQDARGLPIYGEPSVFTSHPLGWERR